MRSQRSRLVPSLGAQSNASRKLPSYVVLRYSERPVLILWPMAWSTDFSSMAHKGSTLNLDLNQLSMDDFSSFFGDILEVSAISWATFRNHPS